jgi:hypothetical protein
MRQNDIFDWPRGGGAMGACLRERDWSDTELGPLPAWPNSLKTAVDILMRLPVPAFLLWGESAVQLYNDACVPLLGKRHPEAFGKPFSTCWPVLWQQNAALRQALQGGGACTLLDLPLDEHASEYRIIVFL